MNLFNYVLFFFLVGFLMIGSQIYQADQELGIDRDIYNYTESNIDLAQINLSQHHPIQKEAGIINEGRLYLIIDSMINFVLTSTEQLTKMGIEFGYEHPNLDFEIIWKYLIIILSIVIALLLLKPLGYIIIFLIMIVIAIKDRKKLKLNKKKKI